MRAALLYLVGTPLALGSYVGFLPLALMLPFLFWRLIDEEHVLAHVATWVHRLPGRVRYRLVPNVW
jgi:hypothetical protein